VLWGIVFRSYPVLANPNPNPATRFKPGQCANPGGRPRRNPTLARVRSIRSKREVEADVDAWRGSARELIETVMRDPDQSLEVRLTCADKLMRLEMDLPGAPRMTPEQQNRRIAELLGRLGPLQIEGHAPQAIEQPPQPSARDQTSCAEASPFPEFQ
jgi:hypothetical protein